MSGGKDRWAWLAPAWVALMAAFLMSAMFAVGVASAGPKTPDVCVAALEDADGLVRVASDYSAMFADHMRAEEAFFASGLSNMGPYVDHLSTLPGQVRELTGRVAESTYATNRQACLELAGEG